MSFFLRAIDFYKRRGFIAFLKQSLGKAIVYTGIVEDVPQARIRISRSLYRELDGIVRYGPFRGLKLDIEYMQWSRVDVSSILLGLYEREVLEELEQLSKENSIFCDVGAADGVYAVGALVCGFFDRSICFEIDPRA
jgi:hypothetical protein